VAQHRDDLQMSGVAELVDEGYTLDAVAAGDEDRGAAGEGGGAAGYGAAVTSGSPPSA